MSAAPLTHRHLIEHEDQPHHGPHGHEHHHGLNETLLPDSIVLVDLATAIHPWPVRDGLVVSEEDHWPTYTVEQAMVLAADILAGCAKALAERTRVPS